MLTGAYHVPSPTITGSVERRRADRPRHWREMRSSDHRSASPAGINCQHGRRITRWRPAGGKPVPFSYGAGAVVTAAVATSSKNSDDADR